MTFRLLSLMCLLVCSLPVVSETCLHYGGNPVTLSGKVKLQTSFGPPSYGENPNSDSRETQAILLLEKPICVGYNPKDYEEAEQNQHQVTLVPLGKENLKDYEGKQITVQGTLYHAFNGHHRTPALIEIKHIERARKKQ